jgi:ATP-dependent DNA ligase
MLWRLRSFPDFVEPCLPSQAERPPNGRDWVHEIKHDGFRLLARRGAQRVRLFTRNGHDWTERFPLIVEALNAIKATKRKTSHYRSGRSRDWVKSKNPAAPAATREIEEDWKKRWR